MNKKKRLVVIVLFIVIAGWAGYQAIGKRGEKIQVVKPLYSGKIIIGTETWPGYFPLFVARDQGYFKELGLDVEIKRYPGLGDLSKDYIAGKMQGRANLTLDAVNEYLEGMDHEIVLVIDYSNGSDAIWARSDIKTIRDFQGKKVGFEPNTLEEFFITWALNQNDMSISDIISVYGNPEKAVDQLITGDVDIAVSHEPYMSKLSGSDKFRLVISSADAPGLITDILTFRRDFIETNPETVEAIVRAYFKGLKFWKEHPDAANAITAKEFGETSKNIGVQLKGIKMLDEHDNQIAFTFAAGLKSLYGNMRQIGKFIIRHRSKASTQLNTDNMIDRQFIKKIFEEKNI